MCDLSVIYVHYNTPALLKKSINSILNQLPSLSLSYEIIIVDNSAGLCADEFSDSAVRVISDGSNCGYAAGVNSGIRSSCGEKLVVLNPDVIPGDRCIAELLRALEIYDVVGPDFYLDDEFHFRLPPREPVSFSYLLCRKLARRLPAFSRLQYRLWRNHVDKYWNSNGYYNGVDLSGAMLVFTRKLFSKIGHWDERFFLFYEETDWLLRCQQAGCSAGYIPSARATHYFSQSIRQLANADEVFSQSEALFLAKYFRKWQIKLLSWFDHYPLHENQTTNIKRHHFTVKPMWLELSYSPSGCPAARARISDSNEFKEGLPMHLRQNLGAPEYYLRWFSESNELIASEKFTT